MRIEQHDKSYLVELEDCSRWRIWPGDIAMTLQWLPTTELHISAISDKLCSGPSLIKRVVQGYE